MLDHTGFVVTDLAAAKRFYRAVGEVLGLGTLDIGPEAFLLGRGPGQRPYLWIGTSRPAFWPAEARAGGAPAHVAFEAESREAVRAFHAAALAQGGRDNGAPGPRPTYGYYGAFALDPDGNNVEACFHGEGWDRPD